MFLALCYLLHRRDRIRRREPPTQGDRRGVAHGPVPADRRPDGAGHRVRWAQLRRVAAARAAPAVGGQGSAVRVRHRARAASRPSGSRSASTSWRCCSSCSTSRSSSSTRTRCERGTLGEYGFWAIVVFSVIFFLTFVYEVARGGLEWGPAPPVPEPRASTPRWCPPHARLVLDHPPGRPRGSSRSGVRRRSGQRTKPPRRHHGNRRRCAR